MAVDDGTRVTAEAFSTGDPDIVHEYSPKPWRGSVGWYGESLWAGEGYS